MKVVASGSIKGGVGKTASAVNLAAEATRSGARVLVWDLDPQGSATYLLRVEHRLAGRGARGLIAADATLGRHVRATMVTGLHLLPSDRSLRFLDLHLDATGDRHRRLAELLQPLHDAYDVVILDCPAGASLAFEGALRASDVLLVPVIPSTLAVVTLAQLEDLVAGRKPRPELLGHVSMLDRRKPLQREIADALLDRPDMLRTVVPNSTAIEGMGPERGPVTAFAPNSVAARAYRALWGELADRLWG